MEKQRIVVRLGSASCSLPDHSQGLVILLMVDAHDEHGGIGTGCRDDHSLGTTLQVSLRTSSNGISALGRSHVGTVLGRSRIRTEAFSMVVNTPVDSTTYWAPASPHLMLAGSLLQTRGGGGFRAGGWVGGSESTHQAWRSTHSWKTVMACPSMTSLPPSAFTSPLKRPWVESYLNM